MKPNCPKSVRPTVPKFLGFWLALLTFAAVPARAAFHPVTLAGRAAATDAEARWPVGAVTLEGVPYELTGGVQLTGLEAARHGVLRPEAIRGLSLPAGTRRLHLLLGAYHGQRDGTPVASVVFRYQDGETRSLRLAYGVHLRNAIPAADEAQPLADPNAALAWQTNVQGGVRHLFRASLDNPRPSEPLAGLELVSLFSRATPVFFAITAQDGEMTPLRPVPRSRAWERATELPDTAWRRELEVRVTSPEDTAVTNAVGTLSLGQDQGALHFGEWRPDARGILRLAFPPQETVNLHLRVNAPGFAPTVLQRSAFDTEPWPEMLEMRLERGVAIGGRVTDTNGQAVAGTTVTAYLLTQASSNEFTRHDFDATMTDTDGRWTAHALPLWTTNLTFEFSHPEHHARHMKFPEAPLRAREAATALVPHLRIAGRVVDAAGQPVPRATVTLDDDDEDVQITRTADGEGRFTFLIRDPADRSATLLVTAPGLAPWSRRVSLGRAEEPLLARLGAGRPFTMRLIEGENRGVPEVRVSLTRWGDTKALVWTNVTDNEGRFRWEHAPEGDVTFRFEKPGYNTHTHSLTLPAGSEVSLVYARPFRIAGRVLDADTGAPVDSVRAQVRYEYANGSGSTSTSGRRGSFNLSIGTTARSIRGATLYLEAPDYDQLVVPIAPPYGSLTNDYKLRKTKKLPVAVLAGGQPAPGAQVLLLLPRESAYMDEPDSFRRNSGNYDVVVADEQGVAALKPRPDADLALALHPTLGYAEVPAATALTNGRIVLQPWGRVQGFLRVGERLEPEHHVAVHTHFIYDSGSRSVPPLYAYLKVKPAADGRFSLYVAPGERMVQLRYFSPGRDSGGMRLSHNLPVTVRAGVTNDVIIGGTGRTVTGKVTLADAPDVKIDGRRGEYKLLLVPGAMPSEIPPPLNYPRGSTAAEREAILREFREKTREVARKRVEARQRAQRTYHVLFDENNGFRVPSIPPGNYSLELRVYDPRAPGSTIRTLGNLKQAVTVPEGTTPLDLGTFTIGSR